MGRGQRTSDEDDRPVPGIRAMAVLLHVESVVRQLAMRAVSSGSRAPTCCLPHTLPTPHAACPIRCSATHTTGCFRSRADRWRQPNSTQALATRNDCVRPSEGECQSRKRQGTAPLRQRSSDRRAPSERRVHMEYLRHPPHPPQPLRQQRAGAPDKRGVGSSSMCGSAGHKTNAWSRHQHLGVCALESQLIASRP